MLKKDSLDEKTKLGQIQLTSKCGQCLHFKNHPHSSKGDTCNKIGIKHFAISPRCFTPDYKQLVHNADMLPLLASLLGNFDTNQRKILLQTLVYSSKLPKHLKFGTKVYFTTGGEYLTSYVSAYVVGKTSSGELVLAGTPSKKSGKVFFAFFPDDLDLLLHKEWRIKKKALLSSGQITSMRNSPAHIKDQYKDWEVPTIDNNTTYMSNLKKKKKKKKIEDVYSVFNVS